MIHFILVASMIALVWAVFILPLVRILQRMGLSGWWVPLGLLTMPISFWVLAHVRWPAVDGKSN
ncbi:MAG TPA: hypothetical protein VGU69_01695 [Rhizomicrobium sp.]|nr:hypothetical protein [Rhizomicrobium sp.]